MQTLGPSWTTVAASGSAASDRQPLLRWQRLLIALRLPLWSAILVTLTIVGMLLAFQQVVLQAVQQGEARRQAAAASDAAVWRCNALRDPGRREICHAQLAVTQTLLATQE